MTHISLLTFLCISLCSINYSIVKLKYNTLYEFNENDPNLIVLQAIKTLYCFLRKRLFFFAHHRIFRPLQPRISQFRVRFCSSFEV